MGVHLMYFKIVDLSIAHFSLIQIFSYAMHGLYYHFLIFQRDTMKKQVPDSHRGQMLDY